MSVRVDTWEIGCVPQPHLDPVVAPGSVGGPSVAGADADAELLCWVFPAGRLHGRMARKWLNALLDAAWPDSGDATFRAVQAFAEIVANAVEHGKPPVTVSLLIGPGRLDCAVADGSSGLPVPHATSADDERHRGLHLVRALLGTAPQIRRMPTGKVVRFSIIAEPAPTAAAASSDRRTDGAPPPPQAAVRPASPHVR
jgi:anti-sigma regulatory factor (Ser/Thr protein kinase)